MVTTIPPLAVVTALTVASASVADDATLSRATRDATTAVLHRLTAQAAQDRIAEMLAERGMA